MKNKHCRALNSTLATLLILQMSVLAPLAHADTVGNHNNGGLPTPAEPAPMNISDIQPHAGTSNAPSTIPMANSLGGAAAPAAAAQIPSAPREPLQAQPGSDEAKAYCYGLTSWDKDKEKAKNWMMQLQRVMPRHIAMVKLPPYAQLAAHPMKFAETAKELLAKKENLCAYGRQTDEKVKEINARLAKVTEAEASAETCVQEGNLKEAIDKTYQLQFTYAKGVDWARNGATDKDGKRTGKGLIQYYSEFAKGHSAEIVKANGVLTKMGTPVPAGAKTLEQEHADIWGPNADKKSVNDLQAPINSRAVFASILDGLHYEQKNAERLSKEVEKFRSTLTTKFKNCDWAKASKTSGKKGDPIKMSSKRKNGGLPIADNDDDNSGVGDGDGDDAAHPKSKKQIAEEKAAKLQEEIDEKKGEMAAEASVKAKQKELNRLNGVKEDPEDTTDTGGNGRSRQSPRDSDRASDERRRYTPEDADRDTRSRIEPLKDSSKSEGGSSASNFLSDNAGLLVGGALVVGGGVGYYFWDKHEKDKKKKEWEDYWNAVKPSSTSTSTATDNSRRLMIRTTVSDGVVGQPLNPPVVVSITDLSGNTLSGQDVDITAACVNPVPCTLVGTLIMRTVNGNATFSNLQFMQAHEGVRLRFSTSFGALDQANGFNVVAPGTGTSTVTTTNSNTNTNTSTNTNTNTNTSTNTSTATRASTDTLIDVRPANRI